MPRKPNKSIQRSTITPDEQMELRCYYSEDEGSFESLERKKGAYEIYKRKFGHSWNQGWRPAGWWQFDAPGPRLELAPGERERDIAALVRLGVATDEEIDLFLKWHRASYQKPDVALMFKWHPEMEIHYRHELEIIRQLGLSEEKKTWPTI
jgi:hypothetical protein